MSETWDILQIARDARLDGRVDVAAQLYAEASQDAAAWVRLSASRPGWKRGPALRAFHRSAAKHARWTDWHGAATERGRTVIGVDYGVARDPDAFEIRILSYANLIVPVWHGVFTGVD